MIKKRSYANRGATLERLINMSNIKYRNSGIADIRKIPTPVKITADFGQKVHGRKEKGELVDYLGSWRGKAIAFDAKETKLNSFPLANVHEHQYKMLESWDKNGAICFLIVSMKKFDKIYLLTFETLCDYWNGAKQGGRKSIPISALQDCHEIKSKDGYALHYLDVFERLL